MLRGEPITFKGVRLMQEKRGKIRMDQKEKIEKLKIPTTEKEFASRRAMAQYTGVNCRPDLCVEVKHIAQVGEYIPKAEFTILRNVITHLRSSPTLGQSYVNTNLERARLALFNDARFGNSKKDKSQLKYIIILADEEDNTNIIHFESSRCQHVTRSVMANEVHALVLGFDATFSLKYLIHGAIGTPPNIEAYVD